MNLTIGQYYPTKSIVHDLDSRTKILATVLYIVAIFVAKGIVGYGICTLFLGCAIFKSNVPFKMLLRGLKSIIIIIIFTVVLNMLFIRTGDLVFRLGFLKIYSGGLYSNSPLCQTYSPCSWFVFAYSHNFSNKVDRGYRKTFETF